MKTIGLIGGMSWESSSEYYRIINEEVKQRLGGLHSAKCILYSVDFEEIETCQRNGDWGKATEILTDRVVVNTVIYKELCLGEIIEESRANYKRIIADLIEQGANGMILGCTEISLLVKAEDSTVPLFDTTLLYAKGAVNLALG